MGDDMMAPTQVPDYFTVIEEPITVLSLLEDLEAPLADSDAGVVENFTLSIRRMWENCWSYNHEGTKVTTFDVCVFSCRRHAITVEDTTCWACFLYCIRNRNCIFLLKY